MLTSGHEAAWSHEGGGLPIELDRPRDECGVVGVYAPDLPVAGIAYGVLLGLQHRGQSGAGVYVQDEVHGLIGHKNTGLVPIAIKEAAPDQAGYSTLDRMSYSAVAIGHTRYSTSKENDASACQPFKGDLTGIGVSHNGHIEGMGAVADTFDVDISRTVSDSHALATVLDGVAHRVGLDDSLAQVLPHLNGAYCLTITDGERLIAARDPWGFHPLALGKFPGGGFVVASEAVAFAPTGAGFERDIERGEIVSIGPGGIRSSFIDRAEPPKHCAFEYVYIARPDGQINEKSVYRARHNMGRFLAEDHPVEADIVVGVPDSGMIAAFGYAEAAGIPIQVGLSKNSYTQRSFMQRGDDRATTLNDKNRVIPDVVRGQRVIIVDDSMIKGNTMRSLIGQFREAGALEVHVRLAASRYEHPCYMGLDTGDPNELAARGRTDEEICAAIGADTAGFNSLERMQQAVVEADSHGRELGALLCNACTTGTYPFALLPQARPHRRQEVFVGLPGFGSS